MVPRELFQGDAPAPARRSGSTPSIRLTRCTPHVVSSDDSLIDNVLSITPAGARWWWARPDLVIEAPPCSSSESSSASLASACSAGLSSRLRSMPCPSSEHPQPISAAVMEHSAIEQTQGAIRAPLKVVHSQSDKSQDSLALLLQRHSRYFLSACRSILRP